jgi:hypothetical protein
MALTLTTLALALALTIVVAVAVAVVAPIVLPLPPFVVSPSVPIVTLTLTLTVSGTWPLVVAVTIIAACVVAHPGSLLDANLAPRSLPPPFLSETQALLRAHSLSRRSAALVDFVPIKVTSNVTDRQTD